MVRGLALSLLPIAVQAWCAVGVSRATVRAWAVPELTGSSFEDLDGERRNAKALERTLERAFPFAVDKAAVQGQAAAATQRVAALEQALLQKLSAENPFPDLGQGSLARRELDLPGKRPAAPSFTGVNLLPCTFRHTRANKTQPQVVPFTPFFFLFFTVSRVLVTGAAGTLASLVYGKLQRATGGGATNLVGLKHPNALATSDKDPRAMNGLLGRRFRGAGCWHEVSAYGRARARALKNAG